MVVSEDDANDKKGESDDSDEEEFFKVRGEGRATFTRLAYLAKKTCHACFSKAMAHRPLMLVLV
jgi:hypothetical protein